MYSNSPRSRIAREFFYILNAMKDHYKALLRIPDTETSRVGPILVLLSIYMIREEGKKKFNPLDIVYETQLPRSSVYRILKEFTDAGILEKDSGEYICAARTPDFLSSPTDLYEKPLAVVKEKDYAAEEAIKIAMENMRIENQRMIQEEIAKVGQQVQPAQPATAYVPAPSDMGIQGIKDMPQPVQIMPMAPIGFNKGKKKDLLDEDIEPLDEEEDNIEAELDDFLL